MRAALLGSGALAAAAIAVACYNPEIANGKLRCSSGGQCPEGFSCDQPSGLCFKDGTGGAGGNDAGAGGGGGSDMCEPMVVSGATCDPVCQSGCGEGLRCDVRDKFAECLGAGSRKEGETCVAGSGDAECGPGLSCLGDACGHRCFKFCRAPADCGQVRCNIAITDSAGTKTEYKACDVPPAECNPVGLLAATSSCAGKGDTGALQCYPTSPTTAGCDCPETIPPKGEGDPCAGDRQCRGGLACINNHCHMLCDLTKPMCSGDRTCKPYMGSPKWGTCE